MKKIYLCMIFLILFVMGFASNSGKQIIDCSGNKVKIPESKDIKRIVVVSPPIFPMILSMVDDYEKVVAVHPLGLKNANEEILIKRYPKIKKMNTTFVKGFNVNVESVLALNPDIIFCYGVQQKKNLDGLNIPIVDFLIPENNDPIYTLSKWTDLLNEIFDLKKSSFIMEELKKIKKIETEKKNKTKVLVIINNVNNKITISASNSYEDYWLNYAGMENVAGNRGGWQGWQEVNIEEIYNWQPDKILIFMGPKAEEYLNGNMGKEWERLKAIKNKEVYNIPKGYFNWNVPNPDSPLMYSWLISLMENDQRSFYEEIKRYYEKNYDIKLDEKDIDSILNPKEGK